MKIIFCGSMYDDIENEIKGIKVSNSVSAHLFQINLLNGLMKNSENIYVINTLGVKYFPYYNQKKITEKDFYIDGRIVGKSIGFVNLPGIHFFSRYFSIKKALEKYIENNINANEKCVIIFFNNFWPIELSALNMKKKYKNVYICGVIGDLFSKYGNSWRASSNLIKSLIINLMNKISDNLSVQYDCFAFLTKDMAYALKVENKPFVVMEGLYTVSTQKKNDFVVPNTENLKIIFYAGLLDKSYGIIHLLNAFEMIDNLEYRLYLAGFGDTENYIKECAEKDSRINFLGFITPQEVAEWQDKAIVLISPRVSKGNEFVKYSFPSKTFECLASGKPYIAHRLPCEPPEYAAHIQYPDDESDEALARKIKEICSLSDEERNIIGEKARKFIEEEKNPTVMTKRIVDMFDSM